MAVLDLLWLMVASLGSLVTAWLVRETRRDLNAAPDKLKALATQSFRHEVFRLVKIVLLLVAISMTLFRGRISDGAIIGIRNGIMAAVIVLLAVNSIWDAWWRLRYASQLKRQGKH